MDSTFNFFYNIFVLDSDPFHPLVTFIRLLLALIFGGIIGFERGRHGQPAGLRTHIIISTGSCLIMLTSIYLGNKYNGDPTRIAAQIVSGIGFLGGAAIIRFKYAIKGVTTVATIWTTAGIGLAIGGGLYLAASLGFGIVIFTLIVLNFFDKKLIKTTSIQKLSIEGKRNVVIIQHIFSVLKTHKIIVHNFGLSEDINRDSLRISFNIRLPLKISIKSLFYDISKVDGVIKIDLE